MRWRRPKAPDTEGLAALEAAQDQLMNEIDRWPEVLRVSSSLRDLRQRNHFGELLRYTMEGPR